MKNISFYIGLFLLSIISNSCAILTNNTNTQSDNYNVATHDEKIIVYKSYYSNNTVSEISPNTTFRVKKVDTYSKMSKRRKVFYNNTSGWVVIMVFKNETDYLTWVHNESMKKTGYDGNTPPSNNSYSPHTYQTGPRGGQYYINSNGNKTYKKKN